MMIMLYDDDCLKGVDCWTISEMQPFQFQNNFSKLFSTPGFLETTPALILPEREALQKKNKFAKLGRCDS